MLKHIISDPELEPVSPEELKEHTYIDSTDEDTYLSNLLRRARARLESDTDRLLVQQSWSVVFSQFTKELLLPNGPLIEVLRVEYLNKEGTYTEVNPSTYRIVTHGLTPKLVLAFNQQWPIVEVSSPDAVKVDYVVGHIPVKDGALDIENASDLGRVELAKQAILILAADWYANREDSAPVKLYSAPNAYKALTAELSLSPI